MIAEQVRLADAFITASLGLAGCLDRDGRPKEALDAARRALGADPLREETYRALMRLHAAAGEPAAAMRRFRQLEQTLCRGGLTPTAATRDLADSIRSGRVEACTYGRADDRTCGGLGPSTPHQAGASPLRQPAARPPVHTSTPPHLHTPTPLHLHTSPQPGGALPLDSPLYLEREADAPFAAALLRGDSIVLVKGPRQVGKSSLLARGLEAARLAGARVVLTDLQKLDALHLASEAALLLALAQLIAAQLDLDTPPEAAWNPRWSPHLNFEQFLRREVLGTLQSGDRGSAEGNTGVKECGSVAAERSGSPPLHHSTSPSLPHSPLTTHHSPVLVWALDEMDRLFERDFGPDFFALLRAWHNERAFDPDSCWVRLTLAIACSTEPHLFITDPDHSPFNVGTRLALEDFTPDQVRELNRRHGAPLRTEAELERFVALVGGHPYLVQRGLHELAAGGWGVAWLETAAGREEGPFAGPLRRLLRALSREPELAAALREALAAGACPDLRAFYRLRSAGVLLGDAPHSVRPRCGVYRDFLTRHLGP